MGINPGLLTGTAAKELTRASELAEQTRQELERLQTKLPQEFAAKITAYDGTTASCSWTMRSYNENGFRIDHTNGVTGSSTWMPAYPVGNGLMPPESFPVDVWMRQRIGNSPKGPILEFDWICGCTPEPAGSSGGGSAIQSACCPNGIPQDLTATISSVDCPDLDGIAIPVTHSTGAGYDLWSSFGFVAGDLTINIEYRCTSAGASTIGLSVSEGGSGVFSENDPASITCDPFSATVNFTTDVGDTLCGTGKTVTVIFTE